MTDQKTNRNKQHYRWNSSVKGKAHLTNLYEGEQKEEEARKEQSNKRENKNRTKQLPEKIGRYTMNNDTKKECKN